MVFNIYYALNSYLVTIANSHDKLSRIIIDSIFFNRKKNLPIKYNSVRFEVVAITSYLFSTC